MAHTIETLTPDPILIIHWHAPYDNESRFLDGVLDVRRIIEAGPERWVVIQNFSGNLPAGRLVRSVAEATTNRDSRWILRNSDIIVVRSTVDASMISNLAETRRRIFATVSTARTLEDATAAAREIIAARETAKV